MNLCLQRKNRKPGEGGTPLLLSRLTWTILTVLAAASAPAIAGVHPVPLEQNTDAAKCLECHNSDDNREFGGTGPNGPHGSKYLHILERRYEMTQAAVPGGPATNLFPNPDLTAAGPYALCAKCHDLAQVLSNSSFSLHGRHISTDGFSCSVCHAPHGIAGSNANVTGERLINFDVNVVGSNGGTPISYSRTAKTCTLTCHSYSHNNSPY
jgi:hypothetical protein